jgi:hypothetical protein
MTFRTICYNYRDTVGALSDNEAIQLLAKACPQLRYEARLDAARYVGTEPKWLTNDQVKLHILQNYKYDAIDISKIVHSASNL